jgi:hypothetical protein
LFPLKKGEKLLFHEIHLLEEYFDAENLKVGSSILPIARQLDLFIRCAKGTKFQDIMNGAGGAPSV